MAGSPPPYTPAKSSTKSYSTRISELRMAIGNYRPGKTIRMESKRPKYPPPATRIGLFGGPGVGKSALINSFLYVTGKLWVHEAPEAFQMEGTFTMKRAAYDLTEHLTVCDNRGLQDFGGKYMTEVGQQIAGARRDREEVEWDRGFMMRMVASLERAFKAKEEFKIHCAVLVINSDMLIPKPSDMSELVNIIIKMTGEPPIVIMTHKDSGPKSHELDSFKSGLRHDLRIEYVFHIENYTKDSHDYDETKHVDILEALNQCTIVGDRILKHAEEQGGCSIL